MKIVRRTLSLVLAFVMVLSLAGCKKKKEGLKEYKLDEMQKVLEDKLGIDEEDIYLGRNDRTQNGYPDADTLDVSYEGVHISASFSDDPQEGKDVFDKSYQQFEKDLQSGMLDEASKSYENKDDSGYYVIKGTDIGSGVFGDSHRSGDVYGAYYCSGSMSLRIINLEPEDADKVEKVLKALDMPCAE